MGKQFIKAALLAFCLFLSFSAKAQTTFEAGAYTCTIISEDDQTVSIIKSGSASLSGAVVIPGSVKNDDGKTYTVTVIGEGAFQMGWGLTSVAIPNSVTSIGNDAFNMCPGLTSITIPDNVTSLGENVFYQCSKLATVTLGNSVTTLGSSAFSGCYGIHTIYSQNTTVPSGGEFDSDVYENATLNVPIGSLGSYQSTFAWSNFNYFVETFTVGDIIYAIISEDERTVSAKRYKNTTFIGEVNIPQTVTFDSKDYTVIAIGDNAFESCAGLTSITIPDKVASIGASAFNNCSALGIVTIGNGVSSIGDGAFDGCSAIRTIYSNNMTAPTWAGSAFTQEVYDNATLNISIEALTSYNTTTGWKEFQKIVAESIVGDFTYYLISDVEETVGVKKYNNTTFNGEVNIPSTVNFGKDYTVTAIGNNAFESCSGLTSVTIPDNVTSIGSGAFNSCTGLISIKIPDNVTSIGGSAFMSCRSLTSVTIPDNVTLIGEKTFAYCSSLTSIKISYNVTSIGQQAFAGCSILTSIMIPDKVASIDAYAFRDAGLTSITIPDNVISIGSGAFANCSGLTSAKIGNGVKEIPNTMFQLCTALATVTIGNSVESIGSNAFSACNAILTVYSRNVKAPTWAGSKFESEVYANATLRVREGGAIGSYNTTDGWKEFAHIVEDVKVGVDEVNSKAVRVFANGGYINVTGVEDNTPIAIYTLQGGLIYSGACDSAPIEVSGAGLYIARIAGKSYKVAVQ